jgi:hypothetical protein
MYRENHSNVSHATGAPVVTTMREFNARTYWAMLALDVKVILAPPCIFDQRFSIQNIQGGTRMTLTSVCTPR